MPNAIGRFKTCSKCGITYKKTEFYSNKSMKDGLDFWCKECKKARQYQYKKDYPDTERRWKDRTAYGFSAQESDYAQYLRKNSVCAICKEKDKNILHVDHDHNTNAVRGLLCHRCNRSLGLLRDNVEILKLAIEYLENPPGIDFNQNQEGL